MTKMMTPFGGAGLPTTADLASSLGKYQREKPMETSGVPFIKLLKGGSWVYGAEAIEVEDGSLWAINPNSFGHGYVCWDDGDKLGEMYQSFTEPLPPKSTMEDVGKPWDRQLGFMLQCVDGKANRGAVVQYTTNSLSGRQAHGGIVDAVVEQLEADGDRPVPIVELGFDKYKHKKYGWIWTPVFKIIDWVSMADPEDTGEAEDTAEEAEEATDVQGEPEEQPQQRRRRRR